MSRYDILETTEEGMLLLNKKRASRKAEEWFEIYELAGLSQCGPNYFYCGHQMEAVGHKENTEDEELIFRLSLRFLAGPRRG